MWWTVNWMEQIFGWLYVLWEFFFIYISDEREKSVVNSNDLFISDVGLVCACVCLMSVFDSIAKVFICIFRLWFKYGKRTHKSWNGKKKKKWEFKRIEKSGGPWKRNLNWEISPSLMEKKNKKKKIEIEKRLRWKLKAFGLFDITFRCDCLTSAYSYTRYTIYSNALCQWHEWVYASHVYAPHTRLYHAIQNKT